GGYLSWHDPVSDHWFQETFFTGTKPKFRDLGKITAKAGQNLRTMILAKTPERFAARRVTSESLLAATAFVRASSESAKAKAEAWRRQIARLKGKKKSRA